MAELLIHGGNPLHGELKIGGRKNSAVAVVPAAILAAGKSTIENLPAIGDVSTYTEILARLGARVDGPSGGVLRVDASSIRPEGAPMDMVKRIRASYYLLGALLGRFRYARVGLPGGCDIGQRPIDQHLKGFRALGADVTIDHGEVVARADDLVGTHIYLDVASVGATINIMLAAILAKGTTVLENCAKEPHIVDVASFLNAMGARVVGAGTDTIKIHGVEELTPACHAIIPDEIEAATYAIAAAATRGDVTLTNVVPKHLDSVCAKLREAGITVEENGDWIRVVAPDRPRAITVKTLPYPGFPTDAMPPMMSLLTLASGTSVISEGVYESRFKHVDELQRMGTNIRVEGRSAVIEGVEQLHGAPVQATNLRAGASLIVAGLAAQGETRVSGVEHVERGYEYLREKLRFLGADIERSSSESDDANEDEARVVNLGRN
ncbi:MAG: UDP-N-acetylglucosamine 1-carboxyvinyltransferase [Bacillota bacterium]